MNNKRLGSAFEQEVCEWYRQHGHWVHFIVPDARGAQPFDIIAVKDNKAVAVDCKTCVANWFNISRLEDNQVMAFEHWMRCGNESPVVAVKHKDVIHWIRYEDLKRERNIKLEG